MQRSLFIKLATIAGLCVLLLLPLSLVENLVSERSALRQGVEQEIADNYSRSQLITGPILIQPYRKIERISKLNEQTGQRETVESETSGRLYFLPERFKLNGTLTTELRRRGIYQARTYSGTHQLQAEFELPAQFNLGDSYSDYRFDTPFLSVGISDSRGIQSISPLKTPQGDHEFVDGSDAPFLGSGIRALLPKLGHELEQKLLVNFEVTLNGTQRIDIVPIGKDSEITLHSDWPHPSFVGANLPQQQHIDAQGFNASWKTSRFGQDQEGALRACIEGGTECTQLISRSSGVRFIDPIDHYLQTERSVKYGLLFVLLTFGGFFLFEIMKNLAVHPIQYALVGLSLALFFLLLLSLSEHLGFALAYAIAAAACIALVSVYVSAVLASWRRALTFAALLSTLYGTLYILIGSEDFALLLGSALLFGVLAMAMLLTRHIDWYRLGRQDASATVAAQG